MKKVGRPYGWRKENPIQRPRRQLAAFEDEWELIKKFADMVKSGEKEKCKKILEAVE